LAVLEGLDDGPVPVMVVVLHAFPALAPGVGGEDVVPQLAADDLLVFDLEDQKAPAVAEVEGGGLSTC